MASFSMERKCNWVHFWLQFEGILYYFGTLTTALKPLGDVRPSPSHRQDILLCTP
jgi:hypothetical protein